MCKNIEKCVKMCKNIEKCVKTLTSVKQFSIIQIEKVETQDGCHYDTTNLNRDYNLKVWALSVAADGSLLLFIQ